MLHENVQGNRVVKLFGQEDYEATRFHAAGRAHLPPLHAQQPRPLAADHGGAGRLRDRAASSGTAARSVIGGHARRRASFVAFLAALVLLYEPFKKLVQHELHHPAGHRGRGARLRAARHALGDRRPSRAPWRCAALRDGIAFEDVWFAYEPGEPVLRDIDLRIPVGEVVALVGMSGGGKSTLADLIPRLYDVTEGRITIDGVDIRDVTLASLRAHIAVVTQFTFLFNDTVRANIAYGDARRRHGRRSSPRRGRRTRTSSSRRCRRATRRVSATSASGSRAASASGSRSRARS